MRRLVNDLRRRRFDLAIDFHSFRETNLLAWLSGAPKRLGMKRYKAAYLSFCFNMPPVPEDKSIHVRDMFLRIIRTLGDGAPVPENLVVPGDARKWASEAVPDPNRVCFYVDSSGPDKSWPPERFAQVADFAVEKLDAGVVILSGKEGQTADLVIRGSRNAARFAVFRGLDLPKMTAVISSSRLLVCNDTGPMHFGPAFGVTTLGLFSVGIPEHFRPTGPRDRFIRENPIERISVDTVTNVVGQMWTKTADQDLQR
jgi:ADP-heptose:LPS heptosyltransferase